MVNRENRKIIEINRLVNQFTSSIQHKPLDSDIDRARVLAFLKSVREVMALGPIKRRPPDTTWKGIPADEATLARNAKKAREIKRTLNKEKKDE